MTTVVDVDERVEEMHHIASRLRCLRVQSVTTRTSNYCIICGVEMPSGSPMVVQVLQRKRYTASWYFCPFCPAPEPDRRAR